MIALVNPQPRYAWIVQAYLSATFILYADGVFIKDGARWEYDVLLLSESIEVSE